MVKDLGKKGIRWEVQFEYQASIYLNTVIAKGFRQGEVAAIGCEGKQSDDAQDFIDGPWDTRELGAEEEFVRVSEETLPEVTKDPIVIMTPGNLAITTSDGQTHNIARTDSIFDPVIDFLKDGDFESAIGLIQQGIVADQVLDLGDNLKVIDGVLYWHGIKQDHGVGNRILSDIANGTFDDRYAKFLGKLLRNSSYKSVMMLYEFLEANKMEILPDGNFIAFKGVKNKENGVWRDWYTGLVPNYQGMTVSMPRNMVEDDPTKACSQGLHIGSKEYASKYGNVMEVSVNPANVVSVPYNYENKKARCCEYYVMKAPMECPAGQAPRIVVGPQGTILEEFWTEGE